MEDRAAEYRARLEEWAGRSVPTDWSWDEFWAVALLSNPRIPLTTRRFIEQWFALVSEREDDARRAAGLDR